MSITFACEFDLNADSASIAVDCSSKVRIARLDTLYCGSTLWNCSTEEEVSAITCLQLNRGNGAEGLADVQLMRVKS
jgi:hypothetical protein